MNIVDVGYDSTHYYVIEHDRHRLLVDVGWPGTLSRLLANLKRKGLEVASLDAFMVTHFHPDHAGLVQDLKNLGVRHLLPDVQMAGIPLLKTYLKPGSGYVELDPSTSVWIGLDESRSWLARLGMQGEIIATPGHSDDSISLVLDEGLALTGDLHPPGMALPEQEADTHLSWEKLRSMGVKMIYPGHGPAAHLY